MVHLDLDALAWLPSTPPQRMPLEQSRLLVDEFVSNNESWVIEGCYTDLLQLIEDRSTEIVFMDLPVEQCIQNAKHRPWEPHKYASKQAQDANLAMLLDWIAQYEQRDDVFSLAAHTGFYDSFSRAKTRIDSNQHTFV